jgi:hypothetical protein
VDCIAEKIEAHPPRQRVDTQILPHCQKRKKDEKSDAATDGEDFENAQSGTR